MFEHYQNQVLLAYRSKLANNQLPHLNAVSPARIRQECVNIFRERYNPKKDDVALRTFFGPDERNRGYLKVIDEHPRNKFRALSIFFQGGIAKPDQKNLELLAWLIDYEDRPYQIKDAYDISTSIHKSEEAVIENLAPTEVEEPPADDQIDDAKEELKQQQGVQVIQSFIDDRESVRDKYEFGFPKKYNKAVASFAAAVAVLIASYVFFNREKQCMYWDGAQYVSVACDEKPDNASVIAFENEKAENLKRILRPDTLTANAVRKVWYNKVWADSIDFYTTAGEVPTDRSKRLMPMTDYILNKYVIQKRSR